MENTFKNNYRVSSYVIDRNMNINLSTVMGILQDIANDHCEALNADRWSLLKSSNAFWVTTKVKLQINELPQMRQDFVAETWCIKNSAVKFERDSKFFNDDKVFLTATSEWVAIDASSHRIRPAKTIAFPFDMQCREDRAIDGDFSKMNYQIEEENRKYSRKILSSDIDVNNHVNNCFYARFVLDCFDNEFLSKHKLKTYETHFINEAHEGEQLDFYVKKFDEDFYVEARAEDKVVIKTLLKFE